MEVHRRLRLAGRSGGEAQQRDVVSPGANRFVANRLVQRDAVQFGVVVGRSIEADHLREEGTVFRARHHLVHQPRVAQRNRDFGLVDDLAQLAGAQHRHRVHHDCARLGRSQPTGDHRRVVCRADQHPVAGLHAVVLGERVGQTVRPVRQLLVRATATVTNESGVVAEALFDDAVGQLNGSVEVLGVVEAVEQ